MASTMIIPASKHTLFMRGFASDQDDSKIREFFTREGGHCSIEFCRANAESNQLYIALRFETKDIARDVFDRFDGTEVMGDKITISYYKDLRRARMRAQEYNRHGGGFGGGGYYHGGRGSFNNYHNKYRGRYDPRPSSGYDRDRSGGGSSGGGYHHYSHSHNRDRHRSYSRSRSRSGSRSYSRSISRSPHRDRRQHSKERPSPKARNRSKTSERKSSERDTSSHRPSSSDRYRDDTKGEHNSDRWEASPRPTSTTPNREHQSSRNRPNSRERQSNKRRRAPRSPSPGECSRSWDQLSGSDDEAGSHTSSHHDDVTPPTDEQTIKANEDNNDKELGERSDGEEHKQHKHRHKKHRKRSRSTSNQRPESAAPDAQHQIQEEFQEDESWQYEIQTVSRNSKRNAHKRSHVDKSSHKETAKSPTDQQALEQPKMTEKDGSHMRKESLEIVALNGGLDDGEKTRPLGLSAEKMALVREKKEEIEKMYRNDCEVFCDVVKMLISKEASLEEKLQAPLRENLKLIGQRSIHELRSFIDTLKAEDTT